jgi:uncharacterized protein (TIRG00374 family)
MLSSALFLWVALRGVDYPTLFAIMAKSNPWWILSAALANLLNLWLRGLRWRLILKSSTVLSRRDAFAATMIGFMANNILPARAGEAIKVYVLAEDHQLSKVTVLATVVIERLFDMLTLLFLVGGLVLVGPPRHGSVMWAAAAYGGIFTGISLILLLGLRLKGGTLARWLETCTGRQSHIHHLARAVPTFTAGLDCLSRERARDLVGVIAMSGLIWLSMFANVVFGVYALSLNLPASASLVVLVMQSLGMIVPSGPANVGVYQFTTVAAATWFGVDRTSALGLSLVLHATRFFPTTFIGFVYLARRFAQRARQSSLAAADGGRAPAGDASVLLEPVSDRTPS